MDWSKLTTYVQLTGAALAIPAAAAGTYSVYQNYFTNDAACHKLRTAIVATMERNVAPDAKRTLLRKDVTEFVKLCGNADPDAKVLFEAALDDHKFAGSAGAQPVPANAVASAMPSGPARTADGIPVWVVNNFGRSPTGRNCLRPRPVYRPESAPARTASQRRPHWPAELDAHPLTLRTCDLPTPPRTAPWRRDRHRRKASRTR